MPWKTQLSSLPTTSPCRRAFMGEGQLLTLWTTSQGCIPEHMALGMSVPGHTAPWGGQRTVVHSPEHWGQPGAPCFVEHKHRQTRARCQRAPQEEGQKAGLVWMNHLDRTHMAWHTNSSAQSFSWKMPFVPSSKACFPMHVRCGTSLVTFQTSILFPQRKCSWNILFSSSSLFFFPFHPTLERRKNW